MCRRPPSGNAVWTATRTASRDTGSSGTLATWRGRKRPGIRVGTVPPAALSGRPRRQKESGELGESRAGIALGVYTALRRHSWLSQLLLALSLVGVSLPNFWLGPVLAMVFAVSLGWLPVSGAGSLAHLVLPAVTLGAALVAAGLVGATGQGIVLPDELVRASRLLDGGGDADDRARRSCGVCRNAKAFHGKADRRTHRADWCVQHAYAGGTGVAVGC